MIRVTFLEHSGFFLELNTICLLFDWWKGNLPLPLPDKPLLVFASHHHPDHFQPAIFSLNSKHRTVQFLMGKDIRLTPSHLKKWGVSEDTAALCHRLGGNQTITPLPGVHVETLPSTDEGVAFLITAEGHNIFHAGDLNWWHWAEEDPAWNADMADNFQYDLQPLEGRAIDLAMFPLDPRLGVDGFRGPAYFLAHTHTAQLLPMHQWGDFAFTTQFLESHPAFGKIVLPITKVGQEFQLFADDSAETPRSVD